MSGMVISGGTRIVDKLWVVRSLWKGEAILYCLYRSEVTRYQGGDITQLKKLQNVVDIW